MKKRVKSKLITLGIIVLIIVGSILIINKKPPQINKEVAKCIGENSVLYVQQGCSHCIREEELFGENYKYLNVVDCFYDREKCGEITGTPTWIINGKKYLGFKSIQELKDLTGCK